MCIHQYSVELEKANEMAQKEAMLKALEDKWQVYLYHPYRHSNSMVELKHSHLFVHMHIVVIHKKQK